jgi:hypothetical protein
MDFRICDEELMVGLSGSADFNVAAGWDKFGMVVAGEKIVVNLDVGGSKIAIERCVI